MIVNRMISKYVLSAVIAVCFLAGCSRSAEEAVDISVNARSAVIMEARSGQVLFEKSPGNKYPPASTTKVMTAIVAFENMNLSDEIVPRKGALNVEPTVAGLKADVKYRLKDLLKAILIKSANDAAVVIAEAVAGSEDEFARMMNEKAREIGMEDTYFATASGLPTGRDDSQYTTSIDLARMMRYALRYPVLVRFMSKKEATIKGSDGIGIQLKTHNRSLYSDNGASWGKTGYTRQARRTFVGVDPSPRTHIIIALLKSNALWSDIDTLKNDGLKLYRKKNRSFLANVLDWISEQRHKGRIAVRMLKPGTGTEAQQ
ncbi:MAG: hypothetical protein GF409_04695 [Candidatus Omnitrophica bacterium]|nr:hypothetical protein [Candidatus Omnitrophota bacterium]